MNTLKFFILFYMISFMYIGSACGNVISPSNKLLEIVNLKDFILSKDVHLRIITSQGKIKNEVAICANSSIVNLALNSKIQNITKVVVAAETESYNQQAKLYSIINAGGLSSPYLRAKVTINLERYEPNIVNLWVFLFSTGGVYASYVQTKCILKDTF